MNMMSRLGLCLTLALPISCAREVKSYAVGALLLHITNISPAIAKSGDVVTLTITSAVTLSACSGTVSGQVISCTPGNGCTCTLTIDDTIAHGLDDLVIHGTGGAVTEQVSGTLVVDKKAPVIDESGVRLLRTTNALTISVEVNASAVAEPGPAYSAQGIAKLTVWNAASAGSAVASATNPGLTAASIAVTSSTTNTFDALWLSATDAAGNESARLAIINQADTTPPQIVTVSPTDNARDVNPQVLVTVTFSKPVAAASVASVASAFSVSLDGTALAGAITLTGAVATFTPSAPLLLTAAYVGAVSTAIVDSAGQHLASANGGRCGARRHRFGGRRGRCLARDGKQRWPIPSSAHATI